jgi:hypothetical protein
MKKVGKKLARCISGKKSHQMHIIDNEIGDAEMAIDQPVNLKVVVILAKRIDQSLRNL